MVCRQVMEGWKGGCPPSDRVVIQGRAYEVTHAQTALGEGYVLWQVEAGDDHGPHVSCRLLVPAGTEEKRLDPLGRTPGLEPVGPDPDGFAASGRTDGPPGLRCQIEEGLLRQHVSVEETLFQALRYGRDVEVLSGGPLPHGQGRREGFAVRHQGLYVRLSDGNYQP